MDARNSVAHRSCLAASLAVSLVLLPSPPVSKAQTINLTGHWQDENGAQYRLRQIAEKLYWSMDARPRVVNVFHGNIYGNIVTGEWADLPGGELQNSGALTLRIESSNRLVKVWESIPYGGSVWTRQGAPGSLPDLSGTWYREGDRTRPCSVRQVGNTLTLVNELGNSSRGHFEDNRIVADDWEGGLRGTIRDNGNRIDWANGTSWQRFPPR